MFCNKCGAENNDDSLFCDKCGNKLNNDINIGAESNNAYELICKKNMFTGFLLNIIAFVLPILMTVFLQFSDSTPQESNSPGDININIDINTPKVDIGIAVIIGILIFGLGMVIYFIKNKKAQRITSMVYLISAIADLTLLAITCRFYVLTTCGLGVVLFIPGILQIIAGTKFVSATRFNR